MSYALMMAAAGLVASVPHASTTSWLDEQVSGSVHVHSSQTMRGQNMTYKAAKVLEMRACKRCRAGELSVTETGCAHYCSEAGYCGFSPEYRRWNCTKPEEVLEQQGSRIVNPQVNPGQMGETAPTRQVAPGLMRPLKCLDCKPGEDGVHNTLGCQRSVRSRIIVDTLSNIKKWIAVLPRGVLQVQLWLFKPRLEIKVSKATQVLAHGVLGFACFCT